ncbi:MAG: hypothetical protein M0026_10320 [Nocardiopsaceae bacterium]|nr:hypothetical protein [Nocardiopsaceae bacterium]
MSDPYRFDSTPTSAPDEEHRTASGSGALRVLVWGVFIVCLAANTVTSLSGAPFLLSSGFGAVALACLIVLTVGYVKGRR